MSQISLGHYMLAVDSTVPGAPCGQLGPRDLAWIEARLAEPFNGPTCLMLHPPLGLCASGSLTRPSGWKAPGSSVICWMPDPARC